MRERIKETDPRKESARKRYLISDHSHGSPMSQTSSPTSGEPNPRSRVRCRPRKKTHTPPPQSANLLSPTRASPPASPEPSLGRALTGDAGKWISPDLLWKPKDVQSFDLRQRSFTAPHHHRHRVRRLQINRAQPSTLTDDAGKTPLALLESLPYLLSLVPEAQTFISKNHHQSWNESAPVILPNTAGSGLTRRRSFAVSAAFWFAVLSKLHFEAQPHGGNQESLICLPLKLDGEHHRK